MGSQASKAFYVSCVLLFNLTEYKAQILCGNAIVITLGYYHDYRTMENIAFDCGVHKQRICEAVSWAEQVLIKDGMFALPLKRRLSETDSGIDVIIVDATECETGRSD